MRDILVDETIGPKITVIGAGGAGGNAVNNMISSNLEGVVFAVANTDAQALKNSQAALKIQLGLEITQGLGAGSKPQVGKAAAEETLTELESIMRGSHMIFIAAGMGGGTGTGAAPVIARKAREMGILTVGVVTKPFHFEGAQRMRLAEQGIQELQHHVDTLIIIPNQNLFRLANEQTTFADAFNMADSVLYSGVRGITDLMVMPGLINLDFADVKTVMSEMGKAMMGTGESSGENRAIAAAEAAISNPLLDEVSMRGARGVLINITGGLDMTLYEVDEAANRIREEVDSDANIIFGSTFDDRMSGTIRVSVVATGIDASSLPPRPQPITLQDTSSEPELAFDIQIQEEIEPVCESFALEIQVEQPNPLSENLEGTASTEEERMEPSLQEQRHTEAPLTPRPTAQRPQEKPSLWQRLRFGAQKPDEAPQHFPEERMPPQDRALGDASEGNGEDNLDIPAFLRRNNKS
jgi:cell division protein FtsZ